MSDIEFPGGIFPKAPPPNAPDFVKGKIKIKVDEAIAFLETKRDLGQEWIDLDVKQSRSGNWYASVDTWQEDRNRSSASSNTRQNTSPITIDASDEDGFDDIPF